MRDEIRRADFVLVICTEAYKRRAEATRNPEKAAGQTARASSSAKTSMSPTAGIKNLSP
jgi:hypothetical protein